MYNNFNKAPNKQPHYINKEKVVNNQQNPNLLGGGNYKVKDDQGSYLEGISKGNHGSNGSDGGSP